MDFLYLLEKIRMPGLNEFMLLITKLGEETAFLVIALVLFWCVDKRKGYYIMAVGFSGTVISQFMKLWFRIPRPWVLDENFTILEEARAAAGGYSFPSGHSQSAVGTFGGIAYATRKKLVRILCIVVAILVPFSRMYIGVHTPLDILVGSALSLVLIYIFRPIVKSDRKAFFPVVIAFMILASVGFLYFVEYYEFPADVDVDNLTSGLKNAYTLLGALLGLVFVYIVDEKWLKFSTKAVWWVQIIKVLIGLLLVVAVKSGLKEPLNSLLGELPGRAARYFLIVIVAGIIWPLAFSNLKKIGSKET